MELLSGLKSLVKCDDGDMMNIKKNLTLLCSPPLFVPSTSAPLQKKQTPVITAADVLASYDALVQSNSQNKIEGTLFCKSFATVEDGTFVLRRVLKNLNFDTGVTFPPLPIRTSHEFTVEFGDLHVVTDITSNVIVPFLVGKQEMDDDMRDLVFLLYSLPKGQVVSTKEAFMETIERSLK